MVNRRKNALRTSFFRTVRGSPGRFAAIALIIALGAALFIGLRTTRDAFVLTAGSYLDRNSFYDFRVLNTYGYEQADVEALAEVEGISAAEGGISLDAIVSLDSGKEAVCKFHSLPETLNTVETVAGRLPENDGECVVDSYYLDASAIGQRLVLSVGNEEDTLSSFREQSFEIVGVIRSPLYINYERGSSSLGTGKISYFAYLPLSCFDLDVFTEVYLRMDGSYELYSDTYDTAVDRLEPAVTAAAEQAADRRLEAIKADAEEELNDARLEYEDGLEEYQTTRADTEAEIADAEQELADGREAITENEEKLQNAEARLSSAAAQLREGEAQLEAAQTELDAKKEEVYAELDAGDALLAEKQAEAEAGLAQVQSGISQLSAGIAEIDAGLTELQSNLPALEAAQAQAAAGAEQAEIAAAAAQAALAADPENPDLQAALTAAQTEAARCRGTADALSAQIAELQATQSTLNAQRAGLEEQLAGLQASEAEILAGLEQIAAGKAEAEAGRAQADTEFAAAQAQIDANREQLESAAAQYSSGLASLRSGKTALEDAKAELQEGEEEVAQAKEEADEAFADAEQELADAEQAIAEAREDIDALEEPEVYVLDRSTNVGYSCFEGDADIVKNVAKIFPVFFFLIAALVCMTTIDKMIDEERGQIGTLKALGYGETAILRKYLSYAGIASFVGVTAGCAIGTCLFPTILWNVYGIMYSMPEQVLLYLNLPLCLLMIAGYLLCMLLVTYLSCRLTMRAVPAELIRPKSPPAGKRLLMERLPFWHKLPFLHKVTWRNIFRYRKRLFMTLLGVGGCTALLVTGYGIRDSIMDVANYQFSTLTVYDGTVTFSEGRTAEEQADFRAVCAESGMEACFVYQASVDISTEKLTKSASLVVPQDSLEGFWNLTDGNAPVSLPGENEVLISRGLAEAMNLGTGDKITLRDADMKELELTVSGVFKNNVYTYVIVSPDTIAAQWGDTPAPQVALLTMPEGADQYLLAAGLLDEEDVISTALTQTTLNWANNVMKALNGVVYLIVSMAAGLAFIVLYNLTNININERIREIATINVLGFRKHETEAYLFRESLLLTLMGSILGLGLGKLLHAFVMDKIRIDMMCFDVRVTLQSYGISVGMTLLFAVLVSFALSFRLQKINMAEALKSNE